MDCSLLAGLLCPAGLERCGTGRGDGMILVAGTTADANRPYYLAIQLQRDAASKNHDFAAVRNMNAEELAPRLRMLCQFLRFNVKCARRVSLLHTWIRRESIDHRLEKAPGLRLWVASEGRQNGIKRAVTTRSDAVIVDEGMQQSSHSGSRYEAAAAFDL